MNLLVDLNENGDLQRRLAKLRSEFAHYEPEPLAVLAKKFNSGDRVDRDGHSKRASRVRSSLTFAATEFVAGATAETFRKFLRDAVRDFAPTIPLFDYSPFEQTVAMTKAQAKKYSSKTIPHDLGQVFLAPSKHLGPQYENVTLEIRRQPAQFAVRDALIAAFCAWDFKTAEQIARDYKLNVPAESHGLREIAIFIHALRDETDLALQMIDLLPTAYDPDFPPQRRDLSVGVLQNDPKLIRSAINAINTRFKNVWTVKTYATPAKIRRLGNMSEMMPKIRDHLHWHHWLISHWAIAWLSFARHRDVKHVFDDPSLFTQWIPWELCTADTEPVLQQKKEQNSTPRMTKARLRELLFDAIQRDDIVEMRNLFDKGVEVEAQNLDKLTPLLYAASHGKAKALKFLLEKGARKNILDLKCRDALVLAAMNGHAEVTRILLRAGFGPNDKRRTNSPLSFAVRARSLDTVRALLESGANPNGSETDFVETPLSIACGLDEPEIVNLLIDAGANLHPDIVDPPLHRAAETKNLHALQMLIKKGANVEATDFAGETALHSAAQADFAEGIEALLAAGANIEAPGRGQTPLLVAADVGAVNAIKVLLKRKANRAARNSRGLTAEDIARGEARKVIRGA